MPAQPATLAERYVLESPVATGGMGAVWKARDQVLARPVAVKLLHAHLSQDEAFLERFRREALAAARLTHPNIVAIYDTGSDASDDGEHHFIVMEFCGGGTLHDLLNAEKALAPEQVCGVGIAVCDALAYAHREQVVHRDVKPGNILITDDRSLKVGDFGIAKAAFVSRDITTTGNILGTVTYLSPEQARGEEPDGRSDLYGLGVVLYEALAGRVPFAGETQLATAMKHIQEAPAPPRSIRAGVPRGLEAVILQALEKDPDSRFQTADEMRAALEDALTPRSTRSSSASTAVMKAPRRAASEGARPARSRPTAWRGLGATLLALLVGAAAVFALTRGTGDGAPEKQRDDAPPDAAASFRPQVVEDFDPAGDGAEHPDEVRLAADGDPATEWTTEDYEESLQVLGKPGVGLLLDLGSARAVSGLALTSSTPGMSLEIRAADVRAEDAAAFDLIDEVEPDEWSEQGRVEIELEAAEQRYWLLWITSFPGGGGGNGAIAEVEFFGA